MDKSLPTILVPYSVGAAASPTQITQAARGIARVLFLVAASESDEDLRRLLGRLGDGLLEARLANGRFDVPAVLRESPPEVVMTFAEQLVGPTGYLAEALDRPGNGTAVRQGALTKSGQRLLLAAAGIDNPASVRVTDAGELGEAVARIGYPCVVKPDNGSGSADTFLIADAEQFGARQADLVAVSAGSAMVVEELLQGKKGPADAVWGDYVSVESVSCGGRHQVLGVTGKLPMAAPARERGHVVPAPFDADLQKSCADLAVAALQAVGHQEGLSQVEMKLTDRGPRIIEVNARLGGYIDQVRTLAGAPSLVRTALTTALSRELPDLQPQAVRVGWCWAKHPPIWARTVAELADLDLVRRQPGVRYVHQNKRIGDPVHWRQGWQDHLVLVFGVSDDHDQARAAVRQLDVAVRVAFEDADGQSHEEDW
jgi:hypothetical protein